MLVHMHEGVHKQTLTMALSGEAPAAGIHPAQEGSSDEHVEEIQQLEEDLKEKLASRASHKLVIALCTWLE